MNKFGNERPERRKDGEERKTNREDVEDQLRGMNESTDVRGELHEIRVRLANMNDLSREEIYRLQIRQAALLDYERAFELPRHRASSRVEDAPDIPELSPELEEKYPIFGAPSKKKLEVAFEKNRQQEILQARREAIRLRLGDASTAVELRNEFERLFGEVAQLRAEREEATSLPERQRIDARILSLEGERHLIRDMIPDPRVVQGNEERTAVQPMPEQPGIAAK